MPRAPGAADRAPWRAIHDARPPAPCRRAPAARRSDFPPTVAPPYRDWSSTHPATTVAPSTGPAPRVPRAVAARHRACAPGARAHALQCILERRGAEAVLDADPVAQVLARARVGLQWPLVPEVDQRAVKGTQIAAHIPALPQHPPLLRVHEPADGAQQARLARAVGSGPLQALTARERKAHPPQDVTITPPQVQALNIQALIVHA